MNQNIDSIIRPLIRWVGQVSRPSANYSDDGDEPLLAQFQQIDEIVLDKVESRHLHGLQICNTFSLQNQSKAKTICVFFSLGFSFFTGGCLSGARSKRVEGAQ